jgi:hypothetical protein
VTSILRDYAIRGYVIDKKRMEKDAVITKGFFAKAQNKLHYAVYAHTATELIISRANAEKEHT